MTFCVKFRCPRRVPPLWAYSPLQIFFYTLDVMSFPNDGGIYCTRLEQNCNNLSRPRKINLPSLFCNSSQKKDGPILLTLIHIAHTVFLIWFVLALTGIRVSCFFVLIQGYISHPLSNRPANVFSCLKGYISGKSYNFP